MEYFIQPDTSMWNLAIVCFIFWVLHIILDYKRADKDRQASNLIPLGLDTAFIVLLWILLSPVGSQIMVPQELSSVVQLRDRQVQEVEKEWSKLEKAKADFYAARTSGNQKRVAEATTALEKEGKKFDAAAKTLIDINGEYVDVLKSQLEKVVADTEYQNQELRKKLDREGKNSGNPEPVLPF